MTVAVLIITHDNVWSSLFEAATNALGCCPIMFEIISVSRYCQPEQVLSQARQYAANTINEGSSVLVLTDMYGSTPSNIACALLDNTHVHVVTGVNLPMLIRVLNYSYLSLQELVEKALSGGTDGIFDCQQHEFDIR